MDVAIIGAGRVGTTLGSAWKLQGHRILFGVRNPQDSKSSKLVADGFNVGIAEEVTSQADVVTLATPWRATKNAIQSAGDLSGKVVIDCTNPLKGSLAGLDVPQNTSGAQQIAEWARDARVYKAFNQTGTENMVAPVFGSQRAVMFVCGDEPGGKEIVMQLVSDVGFEAVDAGGLESARKLEELALLWIYLGANHPDLRRQFAFSILRRR